jgi:Glycerol kinase
VKKFLVAIDQGTTSSRAILFDLQGNIKFTSQFEFTQYFPKNGWVEHNPNEIWTTTIKALKQVIRKASILKGKILSIGITNQRETTILWNKKTGKAIYNAIVWQDRRTQEYCEKLKKKKYENIFRKKTGLFIDPYFSATKIKWILENVKISKRLLKSNNLLFGTVDTYLIWKLTNGKHHLTDSTNASRTMLFNINNNNWDKEILKKLNIPKNILPDVKNSADNFGITNKKIVGYEIPISAVLGDQQAAAVGQSCFEKGSIKSTYGTGAFVIMNTGAQKNLFKK